MALAEITLPRADVDGRRIAVTDTLAGLVTEVAGIVGDPDVSEAEIVRALNRGLFAAAGATRLPELAAEARLVFAPGQADAMLPADVQHGPTDAFLLPASSRIRMLPGLAALRRAARCVPGGRVRCAAAVGGRIHVQPAPQTVVEIVITYHRLPESLVAASDKPRCLPPHLAGPLLVAFACRELFERLEEGAGGTKMQTAAYGKRFEAALAELIALHGLVQEEPVEVAGFSPCGGFGEQWP